MNKTDLFRYKNLLLAKQQELISGKSLADSIPAGSEPRGDPVDMAADEASATVQMRLKQTDSKLLRAIEDALTRIRQERFGTCEECGRPISKARLEAVPWARLCKDCKERQHSRTWYGPGHPSRPGSSEMLFQKREGALAMDGMTAVKVFDFRPVREAILLV